MLKYLKHAAVLATSLPLALGAQSVGASASSQTVASARMGNSEANASMSVEGEMKLARAKGMPDEPIRRRVAEGRTKGASEAQMALAAHRVRLMMEAGVDAMAKGGRAHPSDEEIERCTGAMEQGYTKAQVEAVAHSAPSDRSLTVAFDVLTRLSERGLPVARALDQVTTKLRAREGDEQIN
ncbi:MAG TPA: hypothetical protein VF483_12210, partial [Gemmatimonadaceae bacterium]